jgi:hypothetical protein
MNKHTIRRKVLRFLDFYKKTLEENKRSMLVQTAGANTTALISDCSEAVKSLTEEPADVVSRKGTLPGF